MIADNFELEQPPIEEDDDHECRLLMDMNSASAGDAADDTTFTTAKNTEDLDDTTSNEYVEYHDILRQIRNDSEGTSETEQSLDSDVTGTIPPNNAVNCDEDDASTSRPSQEMKLMLTFLLMVVVGTGMKIFQKLQAIPYVTFVSFTCKCDWHLLSAYLRSVSFSHTYYLLLFSTRMYNYPSSLNLIQNFVYVPLCFMYIIPVSRLGLFNNSIPNEVTTMSKRPFVISEFAM